MSGHTNARRRCVLQLLGVLSLLILTVDAHAITASPSPSYDGSYTVSWSSALGCTYNDDPPFYSYQCASLYENGVEIASSGYSLSVTGKAAGSYEYYVYYTLYVYGSPYDQGTAEGPVTVQVQQLLPPPSMEDQEYASRHGDVDGDGDIDLYVKRVAGTSWTLPAPEILLRQNANGTFNVETSVSQTTRNIVANWGNSVTRPKLVDFNGDGYLDLFVRGLPLANVGPYDVIIFAANGPGAPPTSARLFDESIKKFATDMLSYFEDPLYFNNAYQRACSIFWYGVPNWRRDIDGNYYYYPIPFPAVSCTILTNPNYSYAAVHTAAAITSIFQEGKVVQGSSNAATIQYQLGQLFGTEFMSPAAVSSTKAGLVFSPAEVAILDKLVQSRLAANLAGIFFELLFVGEDGPVIPPGTPHDYTNETVICHTSQPGCTLDYVFSRMLEFPVLGYAVPAPGQPNPCGSLHRSECPIPVANNDQTMVEISEQPGKDDDVGLVVHTVDPTQHVLVNTTMEGHIFHPGSVERRAVLDEIGNVKIVTHGSGTGPYPRMNDVMGPRVFATVDSRIKVYVEGHINGQL